MSVRTLSDPDENKSCLYDSVSETAFGPLFDGSQTDDGANEFLAWYNLHPSWPDLRTLNDEQWRNLLDTYALADPSGDDEDDDDDSETTPA